MAAVGGTFFRAGRLAPILAAAALLAPVLAGSACFKPNITDGGFLCAEGGVCPEDFTCETGTNTCWRMLPDGGLGGKGGAGGKAGAGGVSGAGGAGGETCFEAKPGCEPSDGGTDADLCDPFCQTGCAGCREKCSVNSNSALTCNQVTSTRLKGVLEACTISSGGFDTQSDDCAPGLVCLADGCSSGRCYQYCRKDEDCGNAACDRPIGTSGQKVCDVPYADCNPVGSTSGCSGSAKVACYLSSSRPDHTVCDCPYMAVSTQNICERSRDCVRGLACAAVPGMSGTKWCLQVCGSDDDCFSGVPGSCHPYRGTSGTGTANTTYGFCY
jgi:hypothetical protein